MTADATDNKTAKQLVTEQDNPSYTLTVELHNKEMECRATLTPKDESAAITSDELIAILEKEEISGIDSQLVDDFCNKAIAGGPQKNMLLARGTPPEPGPDGWLEVTVVSASDEAHFKSGANGKIDYKQRHSFENVKPDTVVGKIHPPKDGEPGRTVKNNAIPPLPGNKFKFRSGEGIRLDEDSMSLIAETAGRLIHEGETLSVSEELIINSDVDLSVGHIDFAGVVIIKGDVLDDFNIKATKGIQISGSVGACHITSGGAITIGSVYGKDSCTIKCTGTLVANNLCNVNVECLGDVIVSKEIRDSDIKTLGIINVENGSVCGGKAIALQGIEAKKIGSPLGVDTSLTAGVCYLDSDQEKEMQKRLDVLSFQEEHINYTLGDIAKVDQDSLSESIKKRYDFLATTLEKITKEKIILFKEMAEYNPSLVKTKANPKINVKSILFEGVLIELGNQKEKTKVEKNGPFSICESLEDQCLRYLTLTPL